MSHTICLRNNEAAQFVIPTISSGLSKWRNQLDLCRAASEEIPISSKSTSHLNAQGYRNLSEEKELLYFHDDLSKEETEKLLSSSQNGDFLVRWLDTESSYFLSVKDDYKIRHLRISQEQQNFKFGNECVPTLKEWVRRHIDGKVYVLGLVLLSNPVNRLDVHKDKVLCSRQRICSVCGEELTDKTEKGVNGKLYCEQHCPPPIAAKPVSKLNLLSLRRFFEKSVNLSNITKNEQVRPQIQKIPQSKRSISLAQGPSINESLMKTTLHEGLCHVSESSICEVMADGIVNSISSTGDLSLGALSRSIVEAGGPNLQKDLYAIIQRTSAPIQYGDVIATKGFRLPCKYIFHTILRKWQTGKKVEQELRQAVKKIFDLAKDWELQSVAIPPIGTGILGYPKQIIAQVLYSEAKEYLSKSSTRRVIFAVNGERALSQIYTKLIGDEDGGMNASVNEITVTNNDEVSEYNQKLISTLSTTLERMRKVDKPLSKSGEHISQRPSNWTSPSTYEKLYHLIELNPSSSEYGDVVANIVAADGEKYVKHIAKIERIENEKTYQLYDLLKMFMFRENGSEVTNERLLWHGTNADALENILSTGFDKGYAGAHGISWGKGVYFAAKFSYSAHKQYSAPESQFGLKHILQCRVLTGKSCLGRSGLLEPEFLPDKRKRYDSAVNNVQNPSIFVVFKDYVAYPEYLIKFKD